MNPLTDPTFPPAEPVPRRDETPDARRSGAGSGRFLVQVLGCKVNQYEAQQIRDQLQHRGWRPAEAGQAVELAFVHSCAVTSQAIRKTRQAVRRLRHQHPEARIVVTGCAASEELTETIDVPAQRIPPREGWLGRLDLPRIQRGGSSQDPGPAAHPPSGLSTFHGHVRAFLKIQDGCDLGCSFCIVPRLRRAPRDKPRAAILEEAAALARAGHQELVITGVSVGLYGRDGGRDSLSSILKALLDNPGLRRIRLSSLHPNELTDELLEVWGSSPRLLPHVHLPLQSGSDAVLAEMKRRYTADVFLAACDRARRALDRPALNTDVIVGFPGETDEDFEQTIQVAKAAGFARMHVFPYSPRPHTRAGRRHAEQVHRETIRRRCDELRGVAQTLAASYHRRFVGERAAVLVERRNAATGWCRGYSERYVPTQFRAGPDQIGRIVAVQVDQTSAAGNVASPIDDRSPH